MNSIKKKLMDKTATLGVVGLGYVGLPLAVEKAKAGFKTIGFDVQESKVEMVNAGKNYIGDVVNEDLKNIVEQGHAIIQPRIGIDLEASRKNLFTKIYAGLRRNRFIYKCCIRYLL